MAGRVEDLEDSAAQRNCVPLINQPGGGRWSECVGPGIESLEWDRVDQYLW